MNVRRHLVTAALMTALTTILLGIVYPLVVTVLAQTMFPSKANGELIERGGRTVGAHLIGQRFDGANYFHGRPSAAGREGYDAIASGGTNLGPTSRKLVEDLATRIAAARKENPDRPVPIDLVTSSASGLDPHLSPAAALFQVPRVARARHVDETELRALVTAHVEGRQFGVLGEARVNVLALNLALDDRWPTRN